MFKLTQLKHTKNNVRPAAWMELLKAGAKDKGMNDLLFITKLFWFFTIFDKLDLDISELKPTPYYNLAIFEDIVIHTQQKILHKAITPNENIRQAVVLFKVIFPTVEKINFANNFYFGIDLVNTTPFAVSIRWS